MMTRRGIHMKLAAALGLCLCRIGAATLALGEALAARTAVWPEEKPAPWDLVWIGGGCGNLWAEPSNWTGKAPASSDTVHLHRVDSAGPPAESNS